jgi:A/G-specific adenine glycosylase
LPQADSVEALAEHMRAWPGGGHVLPPLRHALTHFDWSLHPVQWRLPPRLAGAKLAAVQAALPPGRWFTREQALACGLPAPVRKLLAQPR